MRGSRILWSEVMSKLNISSDRLSVNLFRFLVFSLGGQGPLQWVFLLLIIYHSKLHQNFSELKQWNIIKVCSKPVTLYIHVKLGYVCSRSCYMYGRVMMRLLLMSNANHHDKRKIIRWISWNIDDAVLLSSHNIFCNSNSNST